MLRILSRCTTTATSSRRILIPNLPWHHSQTRSMGGAKKSMARARKNFAKKLKREARARILARREVLPSMDKELRKESRIRMLWNVKLILATRNGRLIPSVEFGRLSRDLGFPKPTLFPHFIRQFPGVFKLTSDKIERNVKWLEFSDKAEKLVDHEEVIMREYHEPLIVENLRKLLMMAPARRLLITRIAHIRPSFWIPDDFRESILPKYPQFFTVQGGYLVLGEYDRRLAVSTREKNLNRLSADNLKLRSAPRTRLNEANRSVHAFKISHERHKVMDGNVALRLVSFQLLPFPGPYDPVENLDSRSMEAHKRAVGVCHEFLSLTVEKRAYTDHLAYLRRDFLLPDKLEDLLARFPHIFYVCMKGERHVVFLKEYYRNGELIERHPLGRIRWQFSRLMKFASLSRKPVHPVEFRGICAENFVPKAAPATVVELPRTSYPGAAAEAQQTSPGRPSEDFQSEDFHQPGPDGSVHEPGPSETLHQPAPSAGFHQPGPPESFHQPGSSERFNQPAPSESLHQPAPGGPEGSHRPAFHQPSPSERFGSAPSESFHQPGPSAAFHQLSPSERFHQPGRTAPAAIHQPAPFGSFPQPGRPAPFPGPPTFHQTAAPERFRQPGLPERHRSQMFRPAESQQRPSERFHQPGPSDALQVRQPLKPLEQVRQPDVPLEQQGVFLQLGFSDDDDEDKDDRRKQQSLGQKLGILGDDDDSESEKPEDENPWASWRKPKAKQPENEELVPKVKKRNKKPFWEKRPLDDFNDPFF